MAITYEWRGAFDNDEVHLLHAEAFETEVFGEDEWNWRALTSAHSLGWVTARDGDTLVGFVNVLWDGLVHAWIQDTMVAVSARHRGVGTKLMDHARRAAREAGCEWLHVDFDAELGDLSEGVRVSADQRGADRASGLGAPPPTRQERRRPRSGPSSGGGRYCPGVRGTSLRCLLRAFPSESDLGHRVGRSAGYVPGATPS